jgi:hypothetical protein
VHDPVLQLHEFALQPEQLLEIEPARAAGLVGERGVAVEDAVVHLHLQLFVVRVDQFFLEPPLPLKRHIGLAVFVVHRLPPRYENALCAACARIAQMARHKTVRPII